MSVKFIVYGLTGKILVWKDLRCIHSFNTRNSFLINEWFITRNLAWTFQYIFLFSRKLCDFPSSRDNQLKARKRGTLWIKSGPLVKLIHMLSERIIFILVFITYAFVLLIFRHYFTQCIWYFIIWMIRSTYIFDGFM